MAKKYYSLENIKKTGAQYKMLLGEKSNGKSYAVKSEVIEDAYKNKRYFVYLRRYREDVKTVDVNAYFADAPVKKITGGEYTKVICDKGLIFLANYDEEKNKDIKGPQIGRTVYLTGYEHFASQAFVDVYNIIFEEFITQRLYIINEPGQLQKMVSTILRDREGCSVYLVGNTINRVCPYFQDWQLTHTVNQKQGTIEIYKFHRTAYDEDENPIDIITEVAVEMCESSGSTSNMFFGKTAEFIVEGKWETYDKPSFPGRQDDFEMLYELKLEANGFAFVMQLYCGDDGGMFVFVYPFHNKKKIERVISNKFSSSPLTTKNLNDKINAERLMRELIYNGKICYSDNLTGTDFEQVLNQFGGNL